MLLVIDSGNTNIVFALYQQEESADGQIAVWRMQNLHHRTADEYAAIIQQWLAAKKVTMAMINAVVISSVVPQVLDNLTDFVQKYFDCRLAVVGRNNFVPKMKILLDNPHELGADRLINAWQAFKQYPTNLVVIDFGTATTFDVVSKQGSYRGGIIAPGIQLSMEALAKAAAKLSMGDFQKPENIIGTNTKMAMRSGFFYTTIGMVEKIISGIGSQIEDSEGKDNFPIDMVIATGGLASLVAKETQVIKIVDDNLILKGLAALYHEFFPS